MSNSPQSPMLRLVGARVALTQQEPPIHNAPSGRDFSPPARIARENVAAAALSHDDARWMLAIETERMLEGGEVGAWGARGGARGCGARLRPESRRRLQELATRVGLRPFDANLVIAIVQDAARHEGAGLTPSVASRVSLVGAARGTSIRIVKPGSSRDAAIASVLAAAGLGIAGAVTMVRWLLGGV